MNRPYRRKRRKKDEQKIHWGPIGFSGSSIDDVRGFRMGAG
jgi:hypothetical protein